MAMNGNGVANGNLPIRITLYNPETNEVVGEYSRVFVPWGVLKQAVRLMKGLDVEDLSEEDVDAMAGIVCEAFSNQFSVEDLTRGADVGEMMTVIQQVIGRANFQKGGRGVGKVSGADRTSSAVSGVRGEGSGERPLPVAERLPVMLQEE